MKKFLKTIVAYVNWQQYSGNDHSYSPPKTLCLSFWAFLFGVLMIPFTWIGNIINIFTAKYKTGYPEGLKLNYFFSGTIHFLIILMSILADIFIETFKLGNILIRTEAVESPFLFYLKTIGGGLIGIIILTTIIGIISGIVILCQSGFNKIVELRSRNSDPLKPMKPKKEWLIWEWYDAFKGKYCPTIDWTDVIKNK